ncbi:MAG: alpha/beta fold hydrolase [Actinomycetota bacterium]|nr:alpha/beta fold hydrolase [Actinomycetota bacterium]
MDDQSPLPGVAGGGGSGRATDGGGSGPATSLAATVRRRLHAAPAGVLDGVRADVVLDGRAGDACTLRIRNGLVDVRAGVDGTPTTVITSDPVTLHEVADGTRSGVEAFLDGRLSVRGNLALALELDGLLDHPVPGPRGPAASDARPDRFTRAGNTAAAGVRTFHLEAGPVDAPAVVCLHGLGATNASLLPIFWDLAADHRVLAPDLPGHGASAAPRAQYDAAFFARWLDEWMHQMGIGSAVVLGNSLGGRIALEAALRRPDRIRALLLLAPAVTFRRIRQFVPLVRIMRPELAALPLPMSHIAAVAGIRFLFAKPERLSPSWYGSAAGEFVRLYHKRDHRVAFYSALRNLYLDDAFGQSGFWTRLPRLDTPALFIWGERDRLVPAGFARHVVDAVPRSVSVTFEDCGHVPQFEMPERTSQTIRSFLDGLAPHLVP